MKAQLKWIGNQLIVVSGPMEMMGRVVQTRTIDAQNYSRAYHMSHGGSDRVDTRPMKVSLVMKAG